MEQYLRDIFPQGEGFLQEEWYKQLNSRNKKFRRNFFSLSLLLVSQIPISVFIQALLNRNWIRVIDNGICVAVLLLFFVFTRLFQEKLPMSVFLLSSLPVLILSFYFSTSPFYLMLIATPILAIQILGQRRGIFYTITSLFVFTLFYGLSRWGILPPWMVTPSPLHLIAVYLGTSTVWFLAFSLENHQQQNLNLLINNTLFDRVTRLPGQKVLRNHIDPLKNSLFSILKIVNFTDLGLIFGYELSDSVLSNVADYLISQSTKMGFTVYRLRGSEFGILKDYGEDLNSEDCSAFLENLSDRVNGQIVHWKDSHLTLNVILGGTIVNQGNQEYLSQADLAVNEGIECHIPVVLFSEQSTIRDTALNSMNHYSVLKNNLEGNTLETYFQPIIDSQNHEVIWYETLLRVKGKDGKMSSPVPYLNVAESTGLDRHISDFVLEQACKALKILKTHISINITFNDLRRPEFLENLIRCYPRHETGQGRLILEILERQELHTLDSCQRFLRKAKELGCLVAIDDFGSGYSNYSNVLEIPVDIIKIDGSLIQQIKTNEKARILVGNIVEFSRKLNIKVVAEYVDCPHIADYLTKFGVDFFQGWLYGKAEPLCTICA